MRSRMPADLPCARGSSLQEGCLRLARNHVIWSDGLRDLDESRCRVDCVSSIGLSMRGNARTRSSEMRIVKSGLRRVASHLLHLDRPDHGVPTDLLAHHEQAVGHREHRVLTNLRRRALAKEERRRLLGGEFHRQPLDEFLQR